METENESFERLTDGYRYELFVHCYRMLGSVEDAEDALQETLLRAWRRLETLKTQSALRAWLYKIATHIALDMVDRRKSRLLPSITHPPADPHTELPLPTQEPLWVDPLPESYLQAYQNNPEIQYEAIEDVSLAFLVALQWLPGRQRAILLLCDVLEWKAQEAAETLNMSIAAVNSALQRARTTLKKHQSIDYGETLAAPNEATTLLLNRYVQAWESADILSLLALLRDDATLTMPPFSFWLQGRVAIGAFLERVVFAEKVTGDFRMVATRANRVPAFALYQQTDTNLYALVALHLLTIQAGQILRIDDFLAMNQPLYSRFYLPSPD